MGLGLGLGLGLGVKVRVWVGVGFRVGVSVSTWSRMKLGLEAIVSNRKASEPSGTSAPKAVAGSSVALQQMPTRAHERRRRSALAL